MTLTKVEAAREAIVTTMNPRTEIDTKLETDSIAQPTEKKGLKVLFLSSDTGGGHRASAESLARQFQLLYPGSTYDLLDVVEKDGVPPYNSLVSSYKHLSARPAQWKLVYSVSNTRAFEMLADAHLKLMCERAVRRRIKGYDPDVVVSVHPLMCNVPVLSCKKISNETGKHLPMFTVVTDLGSAHCLWFANGVEKMFVGSDQIWELAKSRGKVPEDKLVKIGLPIRHDFAEQSEKLGDRMSPEGKAYQRQVRKELGLPLVEGDYKTILVMGGGEGVGSLADIVDALYCQLVSEGIDSQVLVVCGRNEKLKKSIDERNWNEVISRWVKARDRQNKSRFSIRDCVGPSSVGAVSGCIESPSMVSSTMRRILSSSSVSAISMPLPSLGRSNSVNEEEKKCSDADVAAEKTSEETDAIEVGLAISPTAASDSSYGNLIDNNVSLDLSECNGNHFPGQVKVVGLGFVTKMAEYMVAADVLVSKAGPGTISEAAALSLPVMLTSYLPGQEEGNVDFTVENGFGAFCSDKDPNGIAEELSMWLQDQEKMKSLSEAAKKAGAPHAARDIAKEIGDRALKWREINDKETKQAKA
jgi:UDP-N-acetylglucosamine:LPS N-acetylglucosamine transferase